MGVFERANLIIRIKNFKVMMLLQVLLGFTTVAVTSKKEAIICVHTLGISIHRFNLLNSKEKCQIVLH